MRTCRICHERFEPFRAMQPTCSAYACQVEYAQRAADKSAGKRAKAERQKDRKAREAMKHTAELKKEAQAAFNAFIRYRDLSGGRACICCGKPFEPQRPGGSVDAGHYLSRGSHPNLAFSEINVNAQRKNCNRPGGTTAAAFRTGMIERYGLLAVEMLESDTEPRRYRAEDYRRIRDEYKQKLKELKRGHENET